MLGSLGSDSLILVMLEERQAIGVNKTVGSLFSVCLLALITILLKKKKFMVFSWYIMGAAVESV